MPIINAICFDLDDTLWETAPVISNAEQVLFAWLTEHYPRVAEQYDFDSMRDLRVAAYSRWPELSHDLTELRLRVLRQVAESTGYEEAMVSGAYAVFFAARNDVTLFADVLPVLDSLAKQFSLIAMSNGNADLRVIGIADYFEKTLGARELGVAKPDVRFFAEAASRCGFKPEEMLHVGDHPENDIAAAKQAGMGAVWLNRVGSNWSLADLQPDAEIESLEGLLEYLEE